MTTTEIAEKCLTVFKDLLGNDSDDASRWEAADQLQKMLSPFTGKNGKLMNQKIITWALWEIVRYCNDKKQWFMIEPNRNYRPISLRSLRETPGAEVFEAEGLARRIIEDGLMRAHRDLLLHAEGEIEQDDTSEEFTDAVYRSHELLDDPAGENKERHRELINAIQEHFDGAELPESINEAVGLSESCMS